jgi:acyl-CoA hydrolase
MLGTQRLYDFVPDNPIIELHPTEYVNNPMRIAQNERMVAINSAIEIDVTGQVCAGSIGPRLYSGVGGQVDFVYGASCSKGGKPTILHRTPSPHSGLQPQGGRSERTRKARLRNEVPVIFRQSRGLACGCLVG